MVPNRDFSPVAWVVDDLTKAMHQWLETTGAEPFFVVPRVPTENVLYRGQPIELDVSVAWAQAGAVQVEPF